VPEQGDTPDAVREFQTTIMGYLASQEARARSRRETVAKRQRGNAVQTLRRAWRTWAVAEGAGANANTATRRDTPDPQVRGWSPGRRRVRFSGRAVRTGGGIYSGGHK